jgi:hypothetical protein
MGFGVGIFLVTVGAILTFAVDVTVSGLDIAVVGVVLMIAGGAGILLNLAVFGSRRRRVRYQRDYHRPYVEPYVEEEVYDDGTPDRPARVSRRVAADDRPIR